jgi:glycosyltransferase involved in cell wall biosynthesis
MTKLRILIVSEHATDIFGGEAILPLHYFRFLRSRDTEVWLITHERTKKRLFEVMPDDIERIFFIPDTLLHIYLHKISQFLPNRISVITTGVVLHMITQLYQYKLVKKLIKTKYINIVHEPAPVSPKQPSILFGLGVPVVIGPLNGGMNFPKAFLYMQGKYEKLLYIVVRLISNIINIVIPGKLFADMILVANKRTRDALPILVKGDIKEFVENGVDLQLWKPSEKEHDDNKEVKFVYFGRLVDWKCVDYLIKAIAQAKSDFEIKLNIVGDGDKRSDLEALVKQLECSEKVVFNGWVNQKYCPEILANADVLVLPSVRECGGAVVLEAMAMELPVIAVNWGGPSDYVTAETGILIEPDSISNFTNQLINAIEKLANNAELRNSMGKAGRKRIVDEFDWEKKIDYMINIYSNLAK